MDAIEKQKENQLKVIKKDGKTKDIVYLKQRTNKSFKLYPKSFDNRSIILLKILAKNENKIDYKDLSYKMLFSEENIVKSHEINFLEKYGMLYDLLEDLVTSKININNANIDEIHLISNLMLGYNKNDLFDEEIIISVKKVNLGKTKL